MLIKNVINIKYLRKNSNAGKATFYKPLFNESPFNTDE